MSEEPSAKRRVETRERYSEWINRSVQFGLVSFVATTVVWVVTENRLALFAGLALYWLGCLGMCVGYWYSPVSVRDELQRRMEREASQLTITVAAGVTIIGVPADVVFSATGVYTAPAAVRGAIWGYLLLILVFAAAHWVVKRQYE